MIAALEAVGALADQVAALARAATDDERDAVVDAVEAVRQQVSALAEETAAH